MPKKDKKEKKIEDSYSIRIKINDNTNLHIVCPPDDEDGDFDYVSQYYMMEDLSGRETIAIFIEPHAATIIMQARESKMKIDGDLAAFPIIDVDVEDEEE